MKIIRCEQRSDEWKTRRLGLVTASNAHKIITPEGKLSNQSRKYLYGLVYERLVGESAERDISYIKAVQEGIEREPVARREFQILTNTVVEQVGMITDDSGKLACSPDGILTGRNEALELKCPQGDTQIGYLLDGLENEYRPQVQFQLLIGRWDAVHFFSFHENTPAFHVVTRPDPAYQRVMAALLNDFVVQLDVETERARKLGPFFRIEALWRPEEIAADDRYVLE